MEGGWVVLPSRAPVFLAHELERSRSPGERIRSCAAWRDPAMCTSFTFLLRALA